MPQRIKWNFEKETKLAMLPDTLIGSSACWHIRAHYANEGAVTDNIKDLYISKEGYLPLLEIRHLFIEGDLQYSKREIKEVRFDILSDRELDIAQIMPNAVVTDFQSEENKPLLPIGSKAPTLVGDIYGSDTDRDTIPYGGKVTMVDFWYMHCPPCRSSIPVLDSLYLVYKDRGVQFVGVNHWDYKTDRLGQLPAFLEKRPIHYPILLADASLEEAFQVHAHPAFFIVDRMGNVAFTNEGYGPGTATKWAETFDELLK
jgi:thiol-disulfide isomerase/thioredoxin